MARQWFGSWHRQGPAGDGKRRSILFIYPFHRQNSRGMLGEVKGDRRVKTDGCDVITVEVALVWHFCQMFGSFLYKTDYCTRSHVHILLSAWITVEFFPNCRLSCRTNNHHTPCYPNKVHDLIIKFKFCLKNKQWNLLQRINMNLFTFLKGRFWLTGSFSKQLITMFCLKRVKMTRNI